MADYGIPAPIVWALATIGFLYVSSFAHSLFRALLSIFVVPGIPLSKFGPKGSWAIITGASDGIGKEYALQLSRKGFNVFLISRTALKLESLAKEIKSQAPKCETKTYAMDFSSNNDADYSKLKGFIGDLDISILINNVGLSHDMPVPFVQTPEQEMKDIITINCMGTLRITQLVAPLLVRRKRGLILTMASFGGFLPTPLLATYSGSKAFLQQWSTALGAELAPYNVTVHLVQSYLVVSAMSKIRRPSAMIPSARTFVKAALGKVGRSTGMGGVAYSGAPYWSHAVMVWALRNIVGTTNGIVLGINKSMHEGIRKRALRKAEREGKKVQ